MLRRRCEACGERLASDAVACWNCGASLAPVRKREVDQSGLIVLLFLLLPPLGGSAALAPSPSPRSPETRACWCCTASVCWS